jgi:hypothetical protein
MLALQKDAKLSFNELKKNHDNIVDSIEKRSRLIIGNLKKQYEDELSNFREENSKLKAKITYIEDKLWSIGIRNIEALDTSALTMKNSQQINPINTANFSNNDFQVKSMDNGYERQ